jgi:hypothetical protein
MSAAPPRPPPTPNEAVSDLERVVVSGFRTEVDEVSVILTPVALSESNAEHVVLDASTATGACAIARLTKGVRKTNPHADTAYVFNVARIAVPKKSRRCCSTIMPCTESVRSCRENDRLKTKGEVFAIANHRLAMLLGGLPYLWRNPSSLPLRNPVCASHRCSMSSSPHSVLVR